ncbi:tetratricopeptide repeat protein [Pseudorhodoplanes sp.]|uniref:tetratricopeptide repeat protein n=1 Tax=Pseudorhodoplanes sp. TaxID=1934341 RepID=UPI00391BFE28
MTVHDAICRLMRIGQLCLIAAACYAVFAGPAEAQSQPVRGEVHVETSQGFARILLHLSEQVETDVKLAGAIVVVHFSRPVDINIEKLSHDLNGVVGAARRDPDGRGLRIALSRRMSMNAMPAGERIYIDLLPDTWRGLAPGLPKEVIEELSRRAREAERRIRTQRQEGIRSERPARVRVATQPTFTRYVFEMPDVIPVTAARGKDDLTLSFNARLKFDFGDLKTTLPATVKAVESFEQNDTVAVRFALNGQADVRTFREDRNFVVDIGSADTPEPVAPVRSGFDDAARLRQELSARPPADVAAPQSIPAGPAGAPSAPQGAASAVPATPPRAQTPPSVPPQAAAAAAAAAVPAAAANAAPAPSLQSAPPDAAKQVQPHAMAEVAPALDALPRDQGRPVNADIRRQADGVRLTFPFAAPTPAAIFRRAGTLWMVFDTRGAISLPDIAAESGGMIRHALGTTLRDSYVLRLMLDRPRLVSASADAGTWTVTIGDHVVTPSTPLAVDRSMAHAARASVAIPLEQARELHRIADPDMGDNLLVVTAPGPARGFVRPQDFVEFRALASVHGVAVQPFADDVQVEVSPNNVIVARPAGLTLSGPGAAARSASNMRPAVLDPQAWGYDRQAKVNERQNALIGSAADAGEGKRSVPRLELARFYLAQEMYAEAKGVLDVTMADERPSADDPSVLLLRAIATLMLDRPEDALKELGHPLLGDQLDAPLWRAFAQARLGRWDEARRGFKGAEGAIASLPVELQRIALKEALRVAIEVRDYETAQNLLSEFQTIGTPAAMEPAVSVLKGRLAQGLGKVPEALRHYRLAAESEDRPSAAQGQLRSLLLRAETGELKRPELISELETLTTVWRGDDTEIEALHTLARLYTEDRRFREAFYVMRSALKAQPESPFSRRIYDEAAITFDSLFLAGTGDTMPAIEALSLFYDFRELTPIGRRGDEMIRRLADRLVSVDLLPQAAELLQHQIDNRLQGAARAQVATRLATVYLMDSKPQRALSVLRATRSADLNTDLRQLRLLLEARALSDAGRHDLALDIAAEIDGREALRLRADILWNARRFGQSAEQIERLHGERWRSFEPLSDAERADILRAAIGYALAEDQIGLGRLRERYEAKMVESADKRAFEVATAPHSANGVEFRELAKTVTAFTSLAAFLREIRERYPEIGPITPGESPPPAQNHTRAPPGRMSTGSIGRRL